MYSTDKDSISARALQKSGVVGVATVFAGARAGADFFPYLTLLGAVFISIGLHLVATWAIASDDPPERLLNTSIGLFLAILSGYYVLKRISDFPSMQAVGAMLTIFTASFLIVVCALLLAGIEHRPLSLFTGYIVTVIWFAAALRLGERRRRPRFALVPIGEAACVRALTGARWTLVDPSMPPDACDGVVIDLGADLDAEWRAYLTACTLAGIPIYHFRTVSEALTGRLEIDSLSQSALAAVGANRGYGVFKRVIDWIAALVAVVALGPFLLLVAVLIRLDSKGAALFRQTRRTKGGQPFTMYKFRTMRVAAAEPDSLQDAMTRDRDPRITRLGAFLRRTRIDELPQILNIFRGEMSWIGPRPEAAPLAEWYERQLPFYGYRYLVRPGITGWAQVNQGHVTELDAVRSKLHYDLYYVKNCSIWLDILIALKTIKTILTGFGAH
ncbi:sugar transferase [Roseiarcus sp.]|uniref:sugar transferase n=1 Tax=Roseiarcus sp. TaxID=1969460 RepID=UPI003F9EB779